MVLYAGDAAVTCSPCQCVGSGCSSTITCFTDAGCTQGGHGFGTLSTCTEVGAYAACRLDSAPTATCTPSGGVVDDPNPVLERFYAFCPATSCGLDASCPGTDAECVVAEGVFAGDCPAGFPIAHKLATSVTASCTACSCTSSCSGDAYTVHGDGFCGIDTPKNVNSTSCTSIELAVLGEWLQPGDIGPSCTPTGGDVEVDRRQERTVCCRTPLDAPPPP